MKFIVEVETEFEESAAEIKDLLEETFFRGNNLFGNVTIIEE